MSQDRGAESRGKFFSDRAATHNFAALENQRLESAFGEIKSGDK
jgi:hypothetical protein